MQAPSPACVHQLSNVNPTGPQGGRNQSIPSECLGYYIGIPGSRTDEQSFRLEITVHLLSSNYDPKISITYTCE